MCGRIACNLCPEEYRKACSYLNDATSKYTKPAWIDSNLTFQPSNNTCPGDSTPILLARDNANRALLAEREEERCIVPMLWGMVPRWHKGDPKKHGLTTINCRLESINGSGDHSKLYETPLKQGKRCVVLCEGYYEFKSAEGAKTKQPYYIYSKQNGFKVEDKSSWKNADWDEGNGWRGPKLLKLAGLYDVWNGEDGQKIPSYTIITMGSDSCLSWLHHRMPAVLDDENAVKEWLDTERVSSSRAVSLLSSCSDVAWHAVSTEVNNSRNKGDSCNQPFEKKPPKATSLQNWLKTGTLKKKSSAEDSEVECKKSKN